MRIKNETPPTRNRYLPLVLAMCLPATLGNTCDVEIKSDTADTGTTGETIIDTGAPGGTSFACEDEFNSFGLIYDELYWACVSTDEGLSGSEAVPSPELQYGPYDPFSGTTTYYSLTPSGDSPENGRNYLWFGSTVPLLVHYDDDETLWPFFFDASCDDYPNRDAAFYYDINGTIGWQLGAEIGGPCDTALPPPFPPPVPNTSGDVLSGPQACTAGNAEFDLAWSGIRAATDDDASGMVTLLATDTGVQVPERAWIREIEVLDWGSSDNIQLIDVDDGEWVFWDGWEVESTSTAFTAPDTVKTFGVGALPFGAPLAVERQDRTAATVALPHLKVTWSCDENPANLHYQTIPGYAGYATLIPAAQPIESRIVFWIAASGNEVLVAPEGRFRDHLSSDLTTHPSGGKTFEVKLPHYFDASLRGRLVAPSGGGYELKDIEVTYNGTTSTLNDRVLSAL